MEVQPEIDIQPAAELSIYEGRTLRLEVTAHGSAPLQYQWLKNGNNVGTNAPFLEINPAVPSDSGNYSVVVGNNAGAVTSSISVVTVTAIIPLVTGRMNCWPLGMGDPTTPDVLASHDLTLTLMDASAYLPAQIGNGLLFGGVDDLLRRDRTNTGTDQALTKRPEFTIAMWVKGLGTQQNLAPGSNGDRRVFAEGSSTNNTPLFCLGTSNDNTTNQMSIFIRDNIATRVQHLRTNATPFDGTWHHIIVTDNRGVLKVFVDGMPDVTVTYPRSTDVLNTLSIGGIARAANSHWFNGEIDEVCTFDRALDDAEIMPFYISQQPKRLTITSLEPLSGNRIRAVVATNMGTQSYQIEQTVDLISGPWVPVPGAMLGPESGGFFTVEFPIGTGPKRFFRVVAP